jgi:hypothetical protein
VRQVNVGNLVGEDLFRRYLRTSGSGSSVVNCRYYLVVRGNPPFYFSRRRKTGNPDLSAHETWQTDPSLCPAGEIYHVRLTPVNDVGPRRQSATSNSRVEIVLSIRISAHMGFAGEMGGIGIFLLQLVGSLMTIHVYLV